MNLFTLMQQRTAEAGPVRVGVIGAGKFASMFLTQALEPARAPRRRRRRPRLRSAPAARWSARAGRASATPRRASTTRCAAAAPTSVDDADELIDSAGIEVILEITGNPIAGAYHADRAIEQGQHVIMVNVEADCMVGPVLAERRAGTASSTRWPTATSPR